MPLITVQMLTGRTPEQKQALIRELAQATKRVLDVPDEALRIVISEIAPEHWGIGSGSMAELRSEHAAERAS